MLLLILNFPNRYIVTKVIYLFIYLFIIIIIIIFFFKWNIYGKFHEYTSTFVINVYYYFFF